MHVTILGCGYVGLELGRRLRDGGHDVLGVRRSAGGVAAIEDAGFRGARADVTDADALAALPDTDALVFLASTGGRGADAARETYLDGLDATRAAYAPRSDPPVRLVYASSTGVYGDHDGGWVDEETPPAPATEKTRVLLDAERRARERFPEAGVDATVVRFAGLYGPERYRLERYLDGPVTEGYLNLLHRDDAAGVVRFVLERGVVPAADPSEPDGSGNRPVPDLLLAVDDEPVPRPVLADWLADACGVAPPGTRTVAERLAAGDLSAAAERRLRTSKRCSNRRLRTLGYRFVRPTYREGYRAAVEAYPDERG